MKSLFQRVLPKSFRSAPAAQDDPGTASPAVAAATATTPQAHRPTSMTARRPLISTNGDVAGFEIRLDEETLNQLVQQESAQAMAEHVASVLVAARLVALDGRVGMARLPAAWLVHASVPKDEPGTVIGLDATPGMDAETVQAVAAAASLFQLAGARLAWGPELDLGIPPEFVLLRSSGQAAAALVDAVHALPAMWKGKPQIVTDVANLEDLEHLLHAGVSFVSGALAAQAQAAAEPVKEKKPLQPEVRNVSLLLHKLAADADSAQIISDLKGDIGLSVRLLQRINSASFAHLGGVASIEQAVAMLGRNELQRWLSLMLMQFAGQRKTSSALQEVALWRSRFVELLAADRGEAEPGQFFTLGLASMLGLILKISPAEVVTTLGLPPMAQQALLAQSGLWAVYLRTAVQVESHSLNDETAQADGFGSAAQVLALSEEAWTWAARHSDRGAR